jgi:hypothetical protein
MFIRCAFEPTQLLPLGRDSVSGSGVEIRSPLCKGSPSPGNVHDQVIAHVSDCDAFVCASRRCSPVPLASRPCTPLPWPLGTPTGPSSSPQRTTMGACISTPLDPGAPSSCGARNDYTRAAAAAARSPPAPLPNLGATTPPAEEPPEAVLMERALSGRSLASAKVRRRRRSEQGTTPKVSGGPRRQCRLWLLRGGARSAIR